jgi:hypothetical protein
MGHQPQISVDQIKSALGPNRRHMSGDRFPPWGPEADLRKSIIDGPLRGMVGSLRGTLGGLPNPSVHCAGTFP